MLEYMSGVLSTTVWTNISIIGGDFFFVWLAEALIACRFGLRYI